MNGFQVLCVTESDVCYDTEGLASPLMDETMDRFVDEYALPGRIITFPDLAWWADGWCWNARIDHTVVSRSYGVNGSDAGRFANRKAVDYLGTRDFIINYGRSIQWIDWNPAPTLILADRYRIEEQ